MKTTFTILALAFTAFVLPSYADPTDAATQASNAHAAFRFGQLEIALPQANPKTTCDISCDGTITYSEKTRVATYPGSAKIVISAPGQKPVTITGENLTVTLDKQVLKVASGALVACPNALNGNRELFGTSERLVPTQKGVREAVKGLFA